MFNFDLFLFVVTFSIIAWQPVDVAETCVNFVDEIATNYAHDYDCLIKAYPDNNSTDKYIIEESILTTTISGLATDKTKFTGREWTRNMYHAVHMTVPSQEDDMKNNKLCKTEEPAYVKKFNEIQDSCDFDGLVDARKRVTKWIERFENCEKKQLE